MASNKFKNNYHEQCEETLKLMQQILQGFAFVKNDKNFHLFLEILSEHGNSILDENDKGGSFGLKLIWNYLIKFKLKE